MALRRQSEMTESDNVPGILRVLAMWLESIRPQTQAAGQVRVTSDPVVQRSVHADAVSEEAAPHEDHSPSACAPGGSGDDPHRDDFSMLVEELNRMIDVKAASASDLAECERRSIEAEAAVGSARARDKVARMDLDQLRMRISVLIRNGGR